MEKFPQTPDGRYFVAAGRMWRCTNPDLPKDERARLVSELSSARSMVQHSKDDPERLAKARQRVHAAKVALGERGPVWWNDGAEDCLQKAPKNTPYADWWASLPEDVRRRGL